MAKVALVPLGSLENQTTFLQSLNENLEVIADALEVPLSRDGTAPNQMEAPLDMNSQRIINLPSPLSASDPVRLIDLQGAQALDVVVVPSLVGNTGKLLSNDGLVLNWVSASTGNLVAANNLSDLPNAGTARTNLGLGTAATFASGAFGQLSAANAWTNTNSFSNTSTFTGQVLLAGTVDHRLTSAPTALTPESLGFRGVPTQTQDSDYTFVLGDSGKRKLHTNASGHTYTIPTNATVAFPIGTILLVRNLGAGAISIARSGGVTLRKDGVATDANASVAQWGSASIIKDGTDVWSIGGVNVT